MTLLWGTVLAGLLLCATAVNLKDAAQGQSQEDVLDNFTPCNSTAVNGTIVLQPNLNVTVCNITVQPPNGTKFTAIQFTSLNMQGPDKLTILDGNDKLISVNGQRDSLTVVVFSSKVLLVVHIDSNNSESVLQATYTNNTCSMQQKIAGVAGMVQSPAYLPNKGAFNCSFTLTQATPTASSGAAAVVNATTGLALSFLNVALSKATLNVTSSYNSSSSVLVNASGLVPDVYGNTIQMTLMVPKTNASQNFSAIASPVTFSSVCGKVMKVGLNQTLNLSIAVSPQTLSPVDCRVTLQAAPNASSLQLNVASPTLKRGDQVVLIDGGSMIGSNVLATFDPSSTSAAGTLVLSGQKEVVLRMTLGLMTGPRKFTASIKALKVTGHLYNSGNVSFAASNATQYYVMEAPAKSVVKFNLPLQQTMNKTFNVSVYDGDQPTSPPLVTFSSVQHLGVPVESSGRRLLVSVQLANGSKPLNGSFSSQAPGCDRINSAPQGMFQLSPSKNMATCRWTIAPSTTSNSTILLDMTMLKLSQNAMVSVFSGVSGSGGSLVAKYANVTSVSSAPLPTVAVAASQWAQVVFSSNKSRSVTSMALSVRYQVVDSYCGGMVQNKQGHLRSPGFPNLYPLNARCQWTFPPIKTPAPSNKTANASGLLFFDFSRFVLAPGHSLVIAEQRNGTSRQVASFNASNLPTSDLLYASNATNTVTFSAQPPKGKVALADQVSQGFDAQYWALSCGGFMNVDNGSFSSPGFPAMIPVAKANATLCVWMIQLSSKPGKDPKVVNMTLNFNKTGALNVTDLFKVYDGNNIRFPLGQLNVTQKGSKGSASFLSRHNATIIVLNITALKSASPAGMKAVVAKLALSVNYTAWSCNKTFQCKNGQCLHPDWRCNGKDDCGDNTDEQNCISPPVPVPSKSASKGMKPAIVVLLFFVGLVLGVLLALVIPRIIRRFRTNRYATFRNEPAVA